jgi:hypothetical protein
MLMPATKMTSPKKSRNWAELCSNVAGLHPSN